MLYTNFTPFGFIPLHSLANSNSCQVKDL